MRRRRRRLGAGVSLDGLPPLRRCIARTGSRRAERSASTSCSTSTSPARSRAPPAQLEHGNVIEIGPGPGGLTRALLRGRRPRHRHREDARCVQRWKSSPRPVPAGLRWSPATRSSRPRCWRRRRAIVANLPYNIATPLLIGWLRPPLPPRP